MKNKLMGIIILLLLSITINVSAKGILKNDIPNRTYVIGTHEFTRDPINGNAFTGDYKGILETKYLMLGSASIDSIAINDMIVYYKNPDGVWLNAVTGEEIENVPNIFNIEYINTKAVTSNNTISNIIKISVVNNTTSACNNLTIEENGTIYLSGTKDCIDFNYVWYSGKLWRITAVNPDGTVKMITDDQISVISYNSADYSYNAPYRGVNFYEISKKNDKSYTGSYMYQFLNEDFLDTLYNYKNIIVEDSTWNITNSNASSDEMSKKLPETTLINNSTIGKNTPVGLLNSYEYYLSYKNIGSTIGYTTGYLEIGSYWWLLNPGNSLYVWVVHNGSASPGLITTTTSTYGVRPVVVLKSNIQLSGGSGTKDDPYTISGEQEKPTINTTLLNTRTVGEYVVFDEDGDDSTKEIYRIVGIEEGKVKLNKNDCIKNGKTVVKKMFSTNPTYGNGDSDDYWDYYLNNTWYNSLASKSMLDKGTYYIKQFNYGTSYKNSLCNTDNTIETTKNCVKTTSIWNGYIGLPRLGEMFASNQENDKSNSSIWLITPYSSSLVWNVTSGYGYTDREDPTNTYAARPSIYLKSNVVITGGNGTKTNPFTIALK